MTLALYVALIAFPYPLFSHEVHSENIVVYSGRSVSPALLSILPEETASRPCGQDPEAHAPKELLKSRVGSQAVELGCAGKATMA